MVPPPTLPRAPFPRHTTDMAGIERAPLTAAAATAVVLEVLGVTLRTVGSRNVPVHWFRFRPMAVAHARARAVTPAAALTIATRVPRLGPVLS